MDDFGFSIRLLNKFQFIYQARGQPRTAMYDIIDFGTSEGSVRGSGRPGKMSKCSVLSSTANIQPQPYFTMIFLIHVLTPKEAYMRMAGSVLPSVESGSTSRFRGMVTLLQSTSPEAVSEPKRSCLKTVVK